MFNLSHKIAGAVYPRYSQLVDKVNRNAQAMEWYRQNRDVPKFADRDSYFEYLDENFLKGQAIDYLEFGVFQGESIEKWAALNQNPESRFVGFDSFEGLPESWNRARGKGAFDVGGNIPDFGDDRVSFQKGWFQDTLPTFLKGFSPRSRLVIHNDSDIYSSTLYVLTSMNHLFPPGTIILFDEFASALNEFSAWRDYLSAYLRKVRPIAMTSDEAARVAFIFE